MNYLFFYLETRGFPEQVQTQSKTLLPRLSVREEDDMSAKACEINHCNALSQDPAASSPTAVRG